MSVVARHGMMCLRAWTGVVHGSSASVGPVFMHAGRALASAVMRRYAGAPGAHARNWASVSTSATDDAPPPPDDEGVVVMGTTPCPYVHRVEMALKYAGVPYAYREFDLGSLKDRSSLREMSPLAKVPIITHYTHGRRKSVFESASIVQYIDDVFVADPEKRLMRGSPYEKAITRSWTHFVNHRVAPQMWNVLLSQTDTALEKNSTELLRSLESLENALPLISGGPFFLGTRVSFFDLMIAPFLYRRVLLSHFRGREMFPPGAEHLQALALAMEELNIFQSTVVDQQVIIDAYKPYLSGSMHLKFGWH
ncbi:putative glutathione S-transferase GSTU6 [Porphyridium purpureum]|uniref:Putative glutathione S-transferase GSTU6 n=1 Tax=Porphyridium purpureum TaxID=35688 RepID=A0A5J4Z249_PORPP|nr:putative glutathione S-transferase GSTU6 [Porphyridium purpureum]|eukprot:POR1698..scf295_1